MLEIRKLVLTLVLCHFMLLCFSQELVFGIMPSSQSLQKQKVNDALSIADINPNFPASWIKEYVSVDLSVTSNGQSFHARGSGFHFNSDQQHLLQLAETGSDIKVSIEYYPENNLPKEIKEMNFKYRVSPDINAEFPGGKQNMLTYLNEKIIDHLSVISKTPVHQAKVSFDINRNGKVTNVKTSERSHSAAIDALLLASITQMPAWTPGRNTNGAVESQSFELIVTRDQCAYSYLTPGE